MKRKFEITPVEGNDNLLQITFKEGFNLKVNKKNRVYVKFVMMLLYYAGSAATYFAPLLGYTDRAFHNIKVYFKKRGVKSLLHGNQGKQNARKITDEYIGKILTLIIQNPRASSVEITEKFNKQDKSQLSYRSIERVRDRYKLFKKK